MCEKNGARLAEAEEVLYRQIHPATLVDDGTPSSLAFMPTREEDEGCLSVNRSSLTTPEAAHALATTARPEGFGLASASVWGVSVGEADTEQVSSWSDPVEAEAGIGPANPAHGVIDFGELGTNARRRVGRNLRTHATRRGVSFKP